MTTSPDPTTGTTSPPPDSAGDPTFDPGAEASAWRTALRRAGLVYLFSRLCVAIGAAIVAAELRADENLRLAELPWARFADPHYAAKPIPRNAVRPMLDVLTSWDGIWYLRIVRMGYPHSVQPNVTYEVSDARAAFFPAYPMLVRAVDTVLPGGDSVAALFTNFVLGAVAILLTGLIARHLFGVRVGERTMLLMALFPGSFVLSFAYTEALLLVFAAACCWFLMQRQWLVAGVFAALGTATRPNGIALIAACAVAAFFAIKDRREWKALIAPALAPVGFIAFQWWIGAHTGERGVWFRVQTEAWGEGTSFGLTAITRTVKAFTHPLTSPTNTITAVSIVTLVLLLWFLRTYRLPPLFVAYVVVIVLLMLLPATVTARPRFVFTAFPLFIPAAVWFERRDHRQLWPYVMSACAAGLVGLTALYGVYGAIP
ncbi:MAG: glycosyltransferase family 39 protein [Actinomycetota bacterium]|nr:glycosyltransferase family 39 protein [Actinomycetota bacterium]